MRKFFITAWLQVALIITSGSLYSHSVAYFSPDDHPTKHLISMLDAAKIRIYAAVYMLTDKSIAQALIRAKTERKVDVQIITDKITITSSFGKGHFLRENGVKVWFFNPPASAPKTKDGFFYAAPAIMHHKFALIDNNVWTGSFNWTHAANQKNLENVIVIDNRDTYRSFKDQFEKLKASCSVLTAADRLGATIQPSRPLD